VYYNHPMIKKDAVEYRAYQVNIATICRAENTLVVLPTGMGKTIIALIVIADALKNTPGKVLFMAPTKPLVEQHAAFIRNFLVPQNVAVFTGEVAPAERDKLWASSRIIVSTPQVISNDILGSRADISQVSLMIFDEAHRAVGDYAYVFIGETFKKCSGRVLAITASPGSSAEKISTVCGNLGITAMELRTEYDADVVNYTHRISINLVEVEMTPNAREISGILRGLLDEKKKELQKHGFALSPKPLGMRDLLGITAMIREKLHSGSKQPSYFHAITLAAMAMKLNQALEYIETQSVGALRNYLERLETEAGGKGASKATKFLVADDRVRQVIKLSREAQAEHPKVVRVTDLVKKMLSARNDSRIIVFTHYRDVSELVTRELEKVPGARPVRFVGQATKGDDKGMRQKEQAEALGRFRNGEFNILVATSVAEEGLDIPSTDFVIFYEPVPSEIRSIQRRGRTGRMQSGTVYILVTKGTRDVPYFWSSVGKERKMKQIIALKERLKETLKVNRPAAENTPKNDILERGMKPGSRNSLAPRDNNLAHDGGEASDKEKLPSRPPPPEKCESRVLPARTEGQLTLLEFPREKNAGKSAIVVDTRELSSEAAKELSMLGFKLDTMQLDTGDYILSERVAVERKEVSDFLQSIIDGRLFAQVMALRRSYIRPLVIVEGDGLFTTRNLSDGAIYGALASITVDFGIPVVFTKDGKETAGFMAAVFKRESSEGHHVSVRGEKRSMSTAERQQFIVEGLPNVSSTLAQRLLSHFGSVRAVIDASAEQLREVRGIGKLTADELVRVLNDKYYGRDEKNRKISKGVPDTVVEDTK
jgi:Fanconi anemia group M protein